MIKKILIFILTLTMCSCFVPAYASTSHIKDTQEQKEVLKALNIADDISGFVCTGDFIQYLTRLIFDAEEEPSAEISELTELIAGGDAYTDEKRITYYDAVRYCVTALGYKNEAEKNKSFMKLAKELGITDSIYLSEREQLNGSAAAQMLINMLDIEPLVRKMVGTQQLYKTAKGETLLSRGRDIVQIQGIVTKNSLTSLTSEKGAGKNHICIENAEYACEKNYDELLGQYVYGYVKHNSSGDDELIYLHEKKNDVLTIAASQLKDIQGNSLRYFKDGQKKLSSVHFDRSTLRVIYNGVFLGDWQDADILTKNGSLTFTDNNNDGKYEVVKVLSYETVIVAGKRSDNMQIISKYSFDNALTRIELDINSMNDSIEIFDAAGEKISFNEININDVLSVAKSRSADLTVIRVLKSSAVEEGVFNGIDNDQKEIKISGKVYGFLDELNKELTKRNITLKMGTTYEYYIDVFGNVVYAEGVTQGNYYVFYKAREYDGDCRVTYMDINETWQTAPLAENVTVNGDKYRQERACDELAYYDPQIVKMKFNSKNEIKQIDTANISAGSRSDDKFIRTQEKEYVYRKNPRTFDGKIWLEDNALVLNLPANAAEKEKYKIYKAADYFSGDTKYTVSAYDIDKYGFTGLVSVKETENTKYVTEAIFLVMSKSYQCIDDEIRAVVKGVCGDFNSYKLIGQNKDTFDGVNTGDVIQVHTDPSGRVDLIGANIIHTDRDNFTVKGASEYYTRNLVISGTVKDVDVAKRRINVDVGDDACFRLTDTAGVKIYDRGKKSCESGKAEDITAGDRIVCRISYTLPVDIIIVRD